MYSDRALYVGSTHELPLAAQGSPGLLGFNRFGGGRLSLPQHALQTSVGQWLYLTT